MQTKIPSIVTKDTDTLASYILVAIGFFLPISVAGVNIMLALLVVLFLWERKYQKRFLKIKYNPIVYIVLAIVLMHIIGCLWSENLSMAGETLRRGWKLMWIPFFMMFMKREHIYYYLQAFIFGMMISEILTYLVWLDILPLFKYATKEMPAPLMQHTYYTPYVAIAAMLLIYFLLYKKHKTLIQKVVIAFFIVTMLINLSFTGGRAGQIGFLVLLFVLIAYYYREKIWKGILVFSIITLLLSSLAYTYVPLFQARADKALYEVTHFKEGMQHTSLGIRLGLNKNYFQVFEEHPWMGVGTGDYLDAYKVVNEKSKYPTPLTHPHNMYMMIFVQFGLLGGIIFLLLFFYQFYEGIKIQDDLQVLRIAFPLFFLVIMTVNWYLYTFNTLFLFIYFSAILYHHYQGKVKLLD